MFLKNDSLKNLAMTDIQKKMYAEIQDSSLLQDSLTAGTNYLEEVFSRSVFPSDQAIAGLQHFQKPLNENPVSAEEVLQDLVQYGGPATMAQVGGRYFGFVNGSVVPAGLAAKILASFWDQNTALQIMSPLAGRLEAVVEGWLRELFNLPEHSVAGFVSGTSTANICGLLAARYRLLERQGWDVIQKGLYGAPPLRIIAGADAHSSVLRAVNILGLGQSHIEWVPADEQGRILPDQVPALDGRCIILLQAGNVNSGAFDPLPKILAKAKAAGAWVHVDGAFGLWAATSPRLSYLTEGLAGVDSCAVDAHKTLNTPYDSGIVLCADREALAHGLQTSGDYLLWSNEREGMRYTLAMSKRSRIIELWATLRSLGKEGLAQMVEGMHDRAQQFALALKAIDGFYVPNDVVFNQVLVHCADDSLTEKVLETVQNSGTCWAGSSSWFGKKVIRISICAWTTTEKDIELSVEAFSKALSENQ